MDKETFASDFQFILLKAIRLFDQEKVRHHADQFERYFISAIKKYVDSLKRKRVSKKRKQELVMIPFSLKKHDIADTKQIPVIEEVSTTDILELCRNKLGDKGVIERRHGGQGSNEICEDLHMTPREYRKIMDRIQTNSQIITAMSRE